MKGTATYNFCSENVKTFSFNLQEEFHPVAVIIRITVEIADLLADELIK